MSLPTVDVHQIRKKGRYSRQSLFTYRGIEAFFRKSNEKMLARKKYYPQFFLSSSEIFPSDVSRKEKTPYFC